MIDDLGIGCRYRVGKLTPILDAVTPEDDVGGPHRRFCFRPVRLRMQVVEHYDAIVAGRYRVLASRLPMNPAPPVTKTLPVTWSISRCRETSAGPTGAASLRTPLPAIA